MKLATLTVAAIGVALAGSSLVPPAFGHVLSPTSHHRHVHHQLAPKSDDGTAIASAAPASAGWTPFQGPFLNPFATPPRPLEWPKIAPYPPGQGDTDGLSRNLDDCNKGCIGP